MIEIPMVERHHEEGLSLRYARKRDCFDTPLLNTCTMQSRVAIARPGRERLGTQAPPYGLCDFHFPSLPIEDAACLPALFSTDSVDHRTRTTTRHELMWATHFPRVTSSLHLALDSGIGEIKVKIQKRLSKKTCLSRPENKIQFTAHVETAADSRNCLSTYRHPTVILFSCPKR